MPTAVMMLSIENTRSSSRICTIAAAKPDPGGRRRTGPGPGRDRRCDGFPWSPSRPGTGRRRSGSGRARRSRGRRPSKIGSVSWTMTAIVPSSASRRISAQADADPARPDALMLGQLVGQDRDEDQVVDAEHHLHHDQGRERHPGGGIGRESDQTVHGATHATRAGRRTINAPAARAALCEPCRRQIDRSLMARPASTSAWGFVPAGPREQKRKAACSGVGCPRGPSR